MPSQDDLARIDRIVALYAGQVASLVTVDPARQRTNIKLDLHFVQFRKNSSHKFGVNWPANIGSHLGAHQTSRRRRSSTRTTSCCARRRRGSW